MPCWPLIPQLKALPRPAEDKRRHKSFVVYLIRHAEADEYTPDPCLTSAGIAEAALTKSELPYFDHIFTSPIRRAMATSVLLFDQESINMTESKSITALPDLQTISHLPQGIGQNPNDLVQQFGGKGINMDAVHEGWNDKDQGRYEATGKIFRKRIAAVNDHLLYLMETAKTHRVIGLVAHTSVFEELLKGDDNINRYGLRFRTSRWVVAVFNDKKRLYVVRRSPDEKLDRR